MEQKAPKVVGVNKVTIRQAQFFWLGQLILETVQDASVHEHDPCGCHLPVRKELYDTMLSDDDSRFWEVVNAEDDQLPSDETHYKNKLCANSLHVADAYPGYSQPFMSVYSNPFVHAA